MNTQKILEMAAALAASGRQIRETIGTLRELFAREAPGDLVQFDAVIDRATVAVTRAELLAMQDAAKHPPAEDDPADGA